MKGKMKYDYHALKKNQPVKIVLNKDGEETMRVTSLNPNEIGDWVPKDMVE